MEQVNYSNLGQLAWRYPRSLRFALKDNAHRQLFLFVLGCSILASAGHIGERLAKQAIAKPSYPSQIDETANTEQDNFSKSKKIKLISGLISSFKISQQQAEHLASVIVAESHAAKLDPLLVASIIRFESSFKINAVSHKGATGLMQLMPSTGKYVSRKELNLDLKSHELKEPTTNLRLGIAYFKRLLESFNNNIEHALIAYNWGPGNLNKALKLRSRIPSAPSRYAKQIINNHGQLQNDLLAAA